MDLAACAALPSWGQRHVSPASRTPSAGPLAISPPAGGPQLEYTDVTAVTESTLVDLFLLAEADYFVGGEKLWETLGVRSLAEADWRKWGGKRRRWRGGADSLS